MDRDLKVACLALIAALSPSVSFATERAPAVLTGQWLVNNCASVQSAQAGIKPTGIGAAAEAGACIGYLGALAEAAPVLNRVLPANARVCTHGPVEFAGLALVVLDYIKRRPAVVGDPRLVVSLAALAEKYPCR